MAAETPGSPEDYSLFLSENGHLSFENPNYQVKSHCLMCESQLWLGKLSISSSLFLLCLGVDISIEDCYFNWVLASVPFCNCWFRLIPPWTLPRSRSTAIPLLHSLPHHFSCDFLLQSILHQSTQFYICDKSHLGWLWKFQGTFHRWIGYFCQKCWGHFEFWSRTGYFSVVVSE